MARRSETAEAVLAALVRIEALAARIAEVLESRERERTVLEQEDLLRLTGLARKAALRRHLRKAGIPFREINGRIFTTAEAFTTTLIGRERKRHDEPRWGVTRGAKCS